MRHSQGHIFNFTILDLLCSNDKQENLTRLLTILIVYIAVFMQTFVWFSSDQKLVNNYQLALTAVYGSSWLFLRKNTIDT